MTWLIILIIVVLILIFWSISIYNGLVRSRNLVKEGWAQIDVQLKRRADLIPNLLETVKGYSAHEKATFEAITQARSGLINAKTPQDAAIADNQLTQALGRLFAVSENYPQLQANENFISLQNSLTETENKISFARQYYNNQVRDYNTKIEVFPQNIFAKQFNFTPFEYYELPADSSDRETPHVKF